MENKPTVFLFNDTQALEESFLEDISNILSSGEVPNLYKPEEFEEVCTRKVLSFSLNIRDMGTFRGGVFIEREVGYCALRSDNGQYRSLV